MWCSPHVWYCSWRHPQHQWRQVHADPQASFFSIFLKKWVLWGSRSRWWTTWRMVNRLSQTFAGYIVLVWCVSEVVLSPSWARLLQCLCVCASKSSKAEHALADTTTTTPSTLKGIANVVSRYEYNRNDIDKGRQYAAAKGHIVQDRQGRSTRE